MIPEISWEELIEALDEDRHDPWLHGQLCLHIEPIARAAAVQAGVRWCDVDDVVQTTLETCIVKLSTLREANKLGGWVKRIGARHASAIGRKNGRLVPIEQIELLCDRSAPIDVLDDDLLDEEAIDAVVDAIAETLTDREQLLLADVTAEPHLSYRYISETRHIAIGSIGPTRQRIISKLRCHPLIAALLDDAA